MSEFGFKFEIGQTVQHKCARQIITPNRWGSTSENSRYFIVSCALEECPAGVQRYYHCRIADSLGGVYIPRERPNGLVTFSEVELCEYVEAPVEPSKP